MKRRSIFAILCFVIWISLKPATGVLAEELPEKYRTEEVSAVEDQGSTNLCWAFAATSMMEAELIKNSKAPLDINLSEFHLAYFCANPAMDALGQQNKIFSGTKSFNQGSTQISTIGSLASGLAPVEETLVPLRLKDAVSSSKLDSALGTMGNIYLKEAKIYRDPSMEEMKKAIMQYGSVLISYDAEQRHYNPETYGWYDPDQDGMYWNYHGVTIVGWDDTYSKDNFYSTPPGDGAWIVKNSWGAEWGDDGYFYLSYYDGPLTDTGHSSWIILDVEYGKYADNLYQNACSVSSGLLVSWDEEGNRIATYQNMGTNFKIIPKVANVFTARANLGGAESLTGISFFTHCAGNYEISIYKNVKANTNPEGGTLAATVKGSIDLPGYKIVPVDTPVYLSEGESFAVVISLTDENGDSVGVDGGDSVGTLSTAGESFLYENNKWVECGYTGYNLFLNAYTENVSCNKELDAKKLTARKTYKFNDFAEDVDGLQVNYIASHSAYLSWNETSDGTYAIYKINDASGTWQKVGYSTKPYYVVTGLEEGKEYRFGVRGIAQDKVYGNQWSSYFEGKNIVEVSTKTKAEPQTMPVLVTSSEKITIRWEELSDATKYEIYVMSQTTDYDWKALATVQKGSALEYTDMELLHGVEYTYRVYAYNGNKLISKGIPVSGTYE